MAKGYRQEPQRCDKAKAVGVQIFYRSWFNEHGEPEIGERKNVDWMRWDRDQDIVDFLDDVRRRCERLDIDKLDVKWWREANTPSEGMPMGRGFKHEWEWILH